MVKIIKSAGRRKVDKYSLVYTWFADPEAGFDFPCDKDGNLLLGEMNEEQMADYEFCEYGNKQEIEFRGVCDQSYIEQIPMIIECICGEHLSIEKTLNICGKCGSKYDAIGNWV